LDKRDLQHYHEERNHQGKENRILFPFQTEARRDMGAVRCRERLAACWSITRGKQPKSLRDIGRWAHNEHIY